MYVCMYKVQKHMNVRANPNTYEHVYVYMYTEMLFLTQMKIFSNNESDLTQNQIQKLSTYVCMLCM